MKYTVILVLAEDFKRPKAIGQFFKMYVLPVSFRDAMFMKKRFKM